MPLWFKSGTETLLINSSGNLIDCGDCPCGFPQTFFCGRCSGGMAECWELVVAGVTDSACTLCSNYNGTHILSYIGFPTNCDFRSSTFAVKSCGTACNDETGYWRMFYNTTNSRWELHGTYTNSNFGGLPVSYYGPTTLNCNSSNTFSFGSENCAFDPCQNWPSSLTVEPTNCP